MISFDQDKIHPKCVCVDPLTHQTYSKGKKLVPHRSMAVSMSDTTMMEEISLMYMTGLFKHLERWGGGWVGDELKMQII